MKILLFFLTLIAYPTAWPDCVSVDCENGIGTFTWPSGAKYVSEFLDGKCIGK